MPAAPPCSTPAVPPPPNPVPGLTPSACFTLVRPVTGGQPPLPWLSPWTSYPSAPSGPDHRPRGSHPQILPATSACTVSLPTVRLALGLALTTRLPCPQFPSSPMHRPGLHFTRAEFVQRPPHPEPGTCPSAAPSGKIPRISTLQLALPTGDGMERMRCRGRGWGRGAGRMPGQDSRAAPCGASAPLVGVAEEWSGHERRCTEEAEALAQGLLSIVWAGHGEPVPQCPEAVTEGALTVLTPAGKGGPTLSPKRKLCEEGPPPGARLQPWHQQETRVPIFSASSARGGSSFLRSHVGRGLLSPHRAGPSAT